MYNNVTQKIVALQQSAQVQYNCNTIKKFLYCSCIVVVLHLCGSLKRRSKSSSLKTGGCRGCATVATVTSEECRAGVPPPALDNVTSGYLASVVLSDTPACSDGRQTWTIRAEPGQQISLKLYDFYAEQPTPAPSIDRQLNHHAFSRGTENFWTRKADPKKPL